MIRNEASQRQVDAADPTRSTWVAANAGSGKTRVLTDRVARLLLDGTDPQNILCLTYTKAAATEMQNRLFKRLGTWAMMADDKLRDDLRELGFDKSIDQETLTKARILFASAIETPGGLKIQTIHSFCASVLRRFPLEAGVSPQFREMEDQTAAKLRADVLDQMADGPEADVTRQMLRHFTGAELDGFLADVASRRSEFTQPSDPAALAKLYGISQDATIQDCIQMAITSADRETANTTSEAFSDQSATYKKFASVLNALSYEEPSIGDFEILKRQFLRSDNGASKSSNYPQSNHTKAVEAAAPIAQDLHEWMDRVAEAYQIELSINALDRTIALHNFAVPFVKQYEARKVALGMLDFDDLIGKTKTLLGDRAVAQWVLFRLDGGIDHVLVDEAQDTSPDQWAVIEYLTREFAAGLGAREDVLRTIFVVGDKQQSIYSFQGADPDAFDEMRDHFSDGLRAAQDQLQTVNLSHSFRSAQAILTTVDNTFQRDRAAAIGKVQNHIAFKTGLPGRVDVWPLIEPTKNKEEAGDWTDPVDQVSEAHHTVQLAQQVAKQIKRMIHHETIPEEIDQTGQYNHRPITAGDFLILVQRRSELFHEIISACKKANLPIAGADRLRVGAELAVKDLTALLQFLALPEDDLSLASALRSPLFGWDERDLYELAHHRTEKFLWAALRDSDHAQTQEILNDLRSQADFLRPYDLIERILTRHGGRKKLLARLGQEAEDGIDALLSQALAYESTEVPSLTGFLTWMQSDALEIKRQMDSQGDQIRVMTVHGSKGLEAPIVILPDTAKRQNDVKADLLRAGGSVLWKTNAKATPKAIAELKDAIRKRQSEERLRLLYVAMTRAETWLIAAAAGDVDDEAWYSIIQQGAQQTGAGLATAGELDVQRVQLGTWAPGILVEKPGTVQDDVSVPVFDPILPGHQDELLSPSDLGGAKVMPGDQGIDSDEDALARGTAIHLLLEHLPARKPSQRKDFAIALLDTLPELVAQEAAIVDTVIKLIEDDSLKELFETDALTEVDISAHLPSMGTRIFGTIDRLIVTTDRVLAIDYKSNRLVPDSPDQVPDGLLRQMGAYAEALAQIYPNRRIETAILWTETAKLMPLPQTLVASALARVSIP